MEKGQLSIHAENLLPIIKKWLYSDQDIFVRELISNGCDAISKRKMAGLADDKPPRIILDINKAQNTLTFTDTGIGMTADEVKKYINQVAFSGASEFLEKYKEQSEQIIGHFGLGFYSAFMVAEKVLIQTLSAAGGATAVSWESDGGMEFQIDEIERDEAGTSITLFINDEAKDFLETSTIRSTLQKYCAFMPVPIYLTVDGRPEGFKDGEENEEPTPINDPQPLYAKMPNACTEDEYKQFYRSTFFDFDEPLFWIHLNVDYPFNLKGILYFPRLKAAYTGNEGQVKLYANQVFVADNIKEVIPEFLLLLKGVIDCPDLPLNVSRSFLQNDGYVRRISDYITRKVADKLTSMFKSEREQYDKYWDDISLFIKYGCIRDQKFYDRMKDSIIYKTTKGESLTLDEYLERAKESHENIAFYTPEPERQEATLRLYDGMDVLVLGSPIDNAFMQHMEAQRSGLRFTRVDANLADALKQEGGDAVAPEQKEKLEALFKWALEDENATIQVENLKDQSLPAMLLQDENIRRYMESMRMYGNSNMPDIPVPSTLVLNGKNPLVQALCAMEQSDTSKSICLEIRDLAELSLQSLPPARMSQFLQRTMELLAQMAK